LGTLRRKRGKRRVGFYKWNEKQAEESKMGLGMAVVPGVCLTKEGGVRARGKGDGGGEKVPITANGGIQGG